MSSIGDLIAWRAALAARDLRREYPGIPIETGAADGPLAERVADALRTDVMTARVAAARGAASALDRDVARSELRLLAPAYLDSIAPALEEECASRRRLALAPWAGVVDAALAAEPDAGRRRVIGARFEQAQARLAPRESDRRNARDEGARRTGVSGTFELQDLAAAPGSAALESEAERGFVAPLDDAVARAVGERWRRFGGFSLETLEACDVPLLSWLPDRRPLCEAARMAGVLRRLGAALGLDPDVAGARLEAVSPAPVAPASHDAVLPRAIVVLGQWGGTRGLADAFEAFGRATRATFLNRVRGVTACALADPAFACAAGMLFRRIASTPSGLRFAAAPESADLVAELRLEETIAARLAWANLAARGASSSMWEPLQRRAAARPVAPGEGEAADRDATHPATRLRGIMFAVMLEERLLSRFGRAWFTARDAGAMLRDLWAAEPDENVVSMAASLGLGTMDSSPLLEAYRLGKGRVA